MVLPPMVWELRSQERICIFGFSFCREWKCGKKPKSARMCLHLVFFETRAIPALRGSQVRAKSWQKLKYTKLQQQWRSLWPAYHLTLSLLSSLIYCELLTTWPLAFFSSLIPIYKEGQICAMSYTWIPGQSKVPAKIEIYTQSCNNNEGYCNLFTTWPLTCYLSCIVTNCSKSVQ